MWSGQSYLLRLLRGVEGWLGAHGHPSEASRVAKIIQKLAQTDDIHEALDALYGVKGFDEFALRLMWHLDLMERGLLEVDNRALEHYASALGGILVAQDETPREAPEDMTFPEKIDQISIPQHEIGRVIEEIKRQSISPGVSNGIEERQLCRLVSGFSSLAEQATRAGRSDLSRLAAACSAFVHYVIDHALLRDVRVVNILDNANLTLQTVLECAGVEDDHSVESTIQLLNQPKDLLD